MSELVVVAYQDAFRAREVRTRLLKMEEVYLMEIEDAVVAVRKSEGGVTLDHMAPLAEEEVLGDSFLGNLIGFIFHQPEPGDAQEHPMGKVSGALGDVGITDEFIKKLTNTLEPGHSALFVLIRSGSNGRVMEELNKSGGTVLQPSLTKLSKALLVDKP